jgi:hypothetical protein
LSWDRGPDRPGPFGGLNCTYFHGKFVIMMIKGEDFLHLRSPNEPHNKKFEGTILAISKCSERIILDYFQNQWNDISVPL